MNDLINRREALDALMEDAPEVWTDSDYELGMKNQHKYDVDVIKALPSVEPESTMGQLTELSQSTKDCISRQAAIDALTEEVEPFAIMEPGTANIVGAGVRVDDIIATLEHLPSAQPRMKGRWIKQVDESINAWWYECSACGDYPLKDAFGHDSLSQFCPWCGAEMSEGEEDD